MGYVEQGGGYKPRPFQERFDPGGQGGKTPRQEPKEIIPDEVVDFQEQQPVETSKIPRGIPETDYHFGGGWGGFVNPIQVPDRLRTRKTEKKGLRQRLQEKLSRLLPQKRSP